MAPAAFAQLGAAPIIMSLLYGATSIHALGKLRMLQGKSRSLDTKKLFTMSVLLLCLTRTMSFVTIGALNMQSVDFDDPMSRRSSWRNDADERFYEKTMMVLFDLPDFMIVSAYTLLAIVWAEAFLQSRRHWLSARVYKRQLLLGYMIFNSALYGGQLVLYTLLFLPSFNNSGVLAVIYLFITSVNLLLPLLLAVLVAYLTCTFSGFPYKSQAAKLRMHLVGRVVMLWTLARVIWGLCALTAVLEFQRLVGSATSLREQVYSILVVAMFLGTELFPLLAALDDDLLLAMSRAEDVTASAGGGRRRERRDLSTDTRRWARQRGRDRAGRHPHTAENVGNPVATAVESASVTQCAKVPCEAPTIGDDMGDSYAQPLLPRGDGRKEDSWHSLSPESGAEQTDGSNLLPKVPRKAEHRGWTDWLRR